ncbi:hypothetical protein AAG747_27570 [Rapidithrix thailandica]|uniref:Lipoprotein n=1 Tax=Rapidithrix thailandica TaxID=413964 RepID=A0AAW9SLS1_9BACT
MNSLKLLLIAGLFLMVSSCKKDDPSIRVTDEQVNEIGNVLAKWGNSHCTMISIEEKDIVWQGPNAGGCSTIYFEYKTPDRDSFYDFEAFAKEMKKLGVEDSWIEREILFRKTYLNHENKVKANLKTLIESSGCDVENLYSQIRSMDTNINEEELRQYLNCLGKVEFTKGAWGQSNENTSLLEVF